jgi:hypothetical protein
MSTPTDRGMVAIQQDGDGKYTVMIGTGFLDGHPVDVRAVHLHREVLEIDPSIRFEHHDAFLRYSKDPAYVFADDSGVVHIHESTSEGPLLSSLEAMGDFEWR